MLSIEFIETRMVCLTEEFLEGLPTHKLIKVKLTIPSQDMEKEIDIISSNPMVKELLYLGDELAHIKVILSDGDSIIFTRDEFLHQKEILWPNFIEDFIVLKCEKYDFFDLAKSCIEYSYKQKINVDENNLDNIKGIMSSLFKTEFSEVLDLRDKKYRSSFSTQCITITVDRERIQIFQNDSKEFSGITFAKNNQRLIILKL